MRRSGRLMGTGRVIRFDEIRGYGFITPDGGGGDIFLHVNDLEVDKDKVKRGTRVVFEVEEGGRGKFATLVRFAAESVASQEVSLSIRSTILSGQMSTLTCSPRGNSGMW
jgi:cold shock CspA family protein